MIGHWSFHKNKDKNYIVHTTAKLISSLTTALNEYQGNGNIETFRTACETAINKEVKIAFNTHRDGVIKQFFGALAEAFSNRWAKLFKTKEEYQLKKGRKTDIAQFFQTEKETTRSANVLYEFNKDLEKAFQAINVEIDEDMSQRNSNN